MPPDSRRGPAPDRPALPHSVELRSTDEGERTAVRQIIESIRVTLPQPTASRWNERERVLCELSAWLNGRKRICDLP